jgi:serine/threonine protein kinase
MSPRAARPAPAPSGDDFDFGATQRAAAQFEEPPVEAVPCDDAPSGVDFPVGHVFDNKFVVTLKLGQGAMGAVYRVTDRETQVEYAVKVLAPDLVGDPRALAELKREMAVAQPLTHQNLLNIKWFADTGPVKYVLMENIDGEDLETYRLRKGGKVSLDDFYRLAPQILTGLEFLHERGVVHLDVKPQNVMLSRRGEIKITDYGISKTIKEQLANRQSVEVPAGTLCFMAPEQLRPGAICDRRTDVYAVGIMFHLLVAGQFPFSTYGREDVLKWHIDEMHVIDTLGSPELTEIVQRALHVDPGERWSSCQQMLDAVSASKSAARKEIAPSRVSAPKRDAQLERIQQLLDFAMDFCVYRAGSMITPGKVFKAADGSYSVPSGGGAALFSQIAKSISGQQLIDLVDELSQLVRQMKYEGRKPDPNLRRKFASLVEEAKTNLQRGPTGLNMFQQITEIGFINEWKKYCNRVIAEFGSL